MATSFVPPPPRTPSPKVRIRSQSFGSPSSRISVTPVEESAFSKSTGSIRAVVPRNGVIKVAGGQGATQSVNGLLLPLNTKMSDDSILSDTSSTSSSVASLPPAPGSNMDLCADEPLPSPSPSPSPSKERQYPHPLAFAQSISYEEQVEDTSASPFQYQDPSYPMYSPWLVRAVLDLYDVRGLDWMSIAGPIARIWGVRASSAEVLDILSSNGRVVGRRWWD
ncbi:hypothetical protein EJ02DRAFT_243752 [Clathrospora elynae]|uniref:Uncharacterized protein n=1 Tax=Clathrospora elynae TaxID=706981 RepID=A0A6A5SJW6_9PLEO|nr:hypothetical protein EJ02DRAFT_243752 [Clathrospora elynae]